MQATGRIFQSAATLGTNDLASHLASGLDVPLAGAPSHSFTERS